MSVRWGGGDFSEKNHDSHFWLLSGLGPVRPSSLAK